MLSIDWRSSAAYEHTKTIPAAGFAWDYLRRNDDYHRDFRAVMRARTPGSRRGSARLDAFMRRWGVRFPT